MKINLGTIHISKEDWELVSIYFTREEARNHMREIAVADIRNEAIGMDSVDELSLVWEGDGEPPKPVKPREKKN